jgi:hypothetical protein
MLYEPTPKLSVLKTRVNKQKAVKMVKKSIDIYTQLKSIKGMAISHLTYGTLILVNIKYRVNIDMWED